MCEFEKYRMMIEKQAHKCSKLWNVDFEEVESQGYLVYCECLEKYDISKCVKFSTFLYIELKSLNEFCRRYKNQQGFQFSDGSELCIESRNYNSIKTYDFIDYASNVLSKDALSILDWILSYSWKKDRIPKPSKNLIIKTFGFNYGKVQRIWNELKKFWNTDGIYYYA